MATPPDAGSDVVNKIDTSDIRKCGFLVKLKTNKKKLFVLREDSSRGPACLEYYDSEKKMKAGVVKRRIVLRSCFNINKKMEKNRHAIVLFTKDDLFTVICENESEQMDWLALMTQLRTAANNDEGSVKVPLFEHIWQVAVKPKELGNEKKLITPGQYRLCLTDNSLSLIKLNQDNGISIPIDCVKRVGHSQHFLFFEFGRCAITGPGSLWLQVEDAVIAQNIHSAVLNSLKLTQPDFRMRASSTASGTNPRKKRSSHAGVAGLSASSRSSLPQRSQSIHVGQTQGGSQSRPDISGRLSQCQIYDRGDFDQVDLQSSGCLRSMTPDTPIEEEEDSVYLSMSHEGGSTITSNGGSDALLPWSSLLRPKDSYPSVQQRSGTASTTDSYLNMTPLCVSASSAATSEGATRRSPSLSGHHGSISTITESKTEGGNSGGDHYLDMMPQGSRKSVIGQNGLSRTASTNQVAQDVATDNLRHANIPHTSPPRSPHVGESRSNVNPSVDSYMLMSPQSSSSSSSSTSTATTQSNSTAVTHLQPPGVTVVSSGDPSDGRGPGRGPPQGGAANDKETAASEYIEMSAPGQEGYLPMSIRRTTDDVPPHGGSSSSVSSVISSVGSSVIESSDANFRSLSRLPELSADGGYIEMSSPSGGVDSSDPPPRPRLDTVHCYLRQDDIQQYRDFPVRAYSVGSKPAVTQHYLDMTGSKGKSPTALADNGCGSSAGCEKSSSAPHLNDDELLEGTLKARNSGAPRNPSIIVGHKFKSDADVIDDRLMELDFVPQGRGEESGGLDEGGGRMRDRTSSGGSRDLRSKAFSFSAKEALKLKAFNFFRKTSQGASAGGNQGGSNTGGAQRTSSSNVGGAAGTGGASSIRPRTESFGNNMRPRAATAGNMGGGGVSAGGWGGWRRVGEGSDKEGLLRKSSDCTGTSGSMLRKASSVQQHQRLAVAGAGTSASSAATAGYMDMTIQPHQPNTSNANRQSSHQATPLPHSTTASQEITSRLVDSDSPYMDLSVERTSGSRSNEYANLSQNSVIVNRSSTSNVTGLGQRSSKTETASVATLSANSDYMDMSAPCTQAQSLAVTAISQRTLQHVAASADSSYMNVGASAQTRSSVVLNTAAPVQQRTSQYSEAVASSLYMDMRPGDSASPPSSTTRVSVNDSPYMDMRPGDGESPSVLANDDRLFLAVHPGRHSTTSVTTYPTASMRETAAGSNVGEAAPSSSVCGICMSVLSDVSICQCGGTMKTAVW